MTAVASRWPAYDELPTVVGTQLGCSWTVFGDGDELGTVNFAGPQERLRALESIRSGTVVNLDYAIGAFDPFPSGTRPPAAHHIFQNNPLHHDDWLDSFYLQSTTQIDGLRHIGFPGLGFYGGVAREEIREDNSRLGIQRWAEHPIVGRGVLLDVAKHLADVGRPIDPRTAYQITVDDLEATVAAQGTVLEDGDVLLFRTGFAEYCRTGMDAADRTAFKADMHVPGLATTKAVTAWLWDHHFAMVAADNLGVESFPYTADNDVTVPDQPKPKKGVDHNGGLHRPLIPLLGFAIGEMFNLEGLAAECARDGRYHFFFSAKPLNVVGGVGSPANAFAIK